MNEINYLSFDPGETTGVATWALNDKGKVDCTLIDQFKLPSLIEFLKEVNTEHLKKIIYEGYRIDPKKLKAHIWSKVETIQTIGRIRFFAEWHDIETVEQPRTILSSAQKWSGMKLPSDHSISNGPSAYNHGYFYLFNQGLIRPRSLDM